MIQENLLTFTDMINNLYAKHTPNEIIHYSSAKRLHYSLRKSILMNDE